MTTYFEDIPVVSLTPTPVAARSKAWGCDRWLAEIAGSNPAGGLHVFLLQMLCVVQVEVYTSGRSFVQGSPTELMCLCVTEKPLRIGGLSPS